jgi:hypothetical protein
MAGELLLINPRKRARKARKHHRRARRHNPVRVLNPRHRRRVKHHARRRHHNPIRRAHHTYRRRRRNPLSMSGLKSGAMGKLTGALLGAGGALVNDVLLTYVPLPAAMKTGPMAILAKAAGAFAVGYLAKFALGAQRGAAMTEGALTVLAYTTVRPMVQTMIPTLAGADIEGLGYYSPGMVLQDTLSPLKSLNTGTPLQAYISGLGGLGANWTAGQGQGQDEDDMYTPNMSAYDPTINAYIS